MALSEKILGTKGKERLDFDLDKYFGVEGSVDWSEVERMAKAPSGDGSPYKMKDLFPETYQAMTTIPSDVDFSQIENADGMFEGCESLLSADGLDISGALTANRLFYGCKALTSVNDMKWKKGISRNYCFAGCESLAQPPVIDFSYAPECRGIFADCKSFPTTFPYKIDFSQYHGSMNVYSNMFIGSSVNEVNITPQVRNVPLESVLSFSYPGPVTSTYEGRPYPGNKNTLYIYEGRYYRYVDYVTSNGYLSQQYVECDESGEILSLKYTKDAFVKYLNGGRFANDYMADVSYTATNSSTGKKEYVTVSVPANDAFDYLIATTEQMYESTYKIMLFGGATEHFDPLSTKTVNFVF